MKDYYQILGISFFAKEEEIKKAYREKAKQYHPDVNINNEDKMVDLTEAYDVLSHSEKRSAYDNFYLRMKLNNILSVVEVQPYNGDNDYYDQEEYTKTSPLKEKEVTKKESFNKKTSIRVTVCATCFSLLLGASLGAGIALARNDVNKDSQTVEQEYTGEDLFTDQFYHIEIDRVIKVGEYTTLSGISSYYGTPISEICGINQLQQNDILQFGQELTIPIYMRHSDMDQYTDEILYTDGTSLEEVAKNYHTTEKTLKRLNKESDGLTLRVPNFQKIDEKFEQTSKKI